jgi:glycine cleavage system H protein
MTVLLFIATIVLFLTVDYFVQRSKKKSTSTIPSFVRVHALRFPDGIFFTKTHTWLNLFPSGKVQMGIDDFLMRMFEHPTLTFLKNEGEYVQRNEPIIKISEGEKELIVRSPINGAIINQNSQIAGKPISQNVALFNDAWAYTVQPRQPKDIRTFLLADETKAWMKGELTKLRDFLAVSQPTPSFVLLQDGGEPMPGVLSNVKNDVVKQFEQEFLNEI